MHLALQRYEILEWWNTQALVSGSSCDLSSPWQGQRGGWGPSPSSLVFLGVFLEVSGPLCLRWPCQERTMTRARCQPVSPWASAQALSGVLLLGISAQAPACILSLPKSNCSLLQLCRLAHGHTWPSFFLSQGNLHILLLVVGRGGQALEKQTAALSRPFHATTSLGCGHTLFWSLCGWLGDHSAAPLVTA